MKMKKNRGFTLVEILIVVIILGILAAIVIPQFTNASSDARNSSVQSTLQTIRSQMELFKLQHSDTPPTVTAITGWQLMLTTSTTTETTITNPAGTNFGPYMQTAPVNPLNSSSTVAAAAGAGVGWVYVLSGNIYTIRATNTTMTGTLTY
jgi:general secretion pathway protein G